jgi:hypothetical protein
MQDVLEIRLDHDRRGQTDRIGEFSDALEGGSRAAGLRYPPQFLNPATWNRLFRGTFLPWDFQKCRIPTAGRAPPRWSPPQDDTRSNHRQWDLGSIDCKDSGFPPYRHESMGQQDRKTVR